MLELTIIIIGILFLVSFVLFDSDILAPPTVVALVMFFGALCTFYNEERWGLEFSPKTMGLIVTAIVATMIGGLLGVVLSNLRKGEVTYRFSHRVEQPQEIVVSPIRVWIVIAFQLVTLYLLFIYIRRVSGYSDWISTIHRYRQMTTVEEYADQLTEHMSFLLRNMVQADRMIGLMFSYIVGNNLAASKKKISLNWIPVLLYTVAIFIQGGRANMIRLWLTVIIVAYTVHRRSVGWRKSRETKKLIKMMALSLVAVGVIFVGVREFVGRTSTKDPFYYVTFYAGTPIAVLDQFWRDPIPKPKIFGAKTFWYLNHSLTALIGWPGKSKFYSPFITSPTGVSIGNAPTALRDPYTEFGFWGFVLLMTAFGALYTLLYCNCRNKRGRSPIDMHLLIYTFIAYTFFMYFYASFNEFLSHLMFKYIIEWLLIRWFLIGWRFRRSVRLFSYGGAERSAARLPDGAD